MKIEDIPTKTFNRVIAELLEEGWEKIYVYDGFDAWIDYAEVHLRKANSDLWFTWDNWLEGKVEGEAIVLQQLREKHCF